jgi:hypothetical protein
VTQIHTDILLLVPQFLLLGCIVGGMAYGLATLAHVFTSVATTGRE